MIRSKLEKLSREELVDEVCRLNQRLGGQIGISNGLRSNVVRLKADLLLIKRQLGRMCDNIQFGCGDKGKATVRYFSGGKVSRKKK